MVLLMNFINMTPHAINLVDCDGNIYRTIEPCGSLIRLKATTERIKEIDGIKLSTTVFGEVEGLPDYAKDTYYIVSQLVKSALPSRTDLLVPAEMVRDEKGVIIGCKSLGI